MSNYFHLRAGLKLVFFFLIIFTACEEDPESTEEECDYSTYNPSTADYSCNAGYTAVDGFSCCPSNALYHCPSLGKCYTSCEAATNAGCGNIVFSTTSGGSGGGGNCTGSYNGPTGDIQSDSFCQAAWNYRCNGQNAQADANCTVYKQLQDDNPGMPDCPYCP